MKRFYHAVNLRSRAEMTLFLQNHFRYDTMNSWNQSTSYACNLKIHRLGLSAEIVDRLYEMMETQEFFDAMRELRDDFNAAHNYRWQAEMNGRSGGYLVLYQGELRPSGYQSFCTSCGQRNYKSIKESRAISAAGAAGRHGLTTPEHRCRLSHSPDGEQTTARTMKTGAWISCESASSSFRSWTVWQMPWFSAELIWQIITRSRRRNTSCHKQERC